MAWKLALQLVQKLELLQCAQLVTLQETQVPLVVAVNPSWQLMQMLTLVGHPLGRQLASEHSKTQELLARVLPGWQA